LLSTNAPAMNAELGLSKLAFLKRLYTYPFLTPKGHTCRVGWIVVQSVFVLALYHTGPAVNAFRDFDNTNIKAAIPF
jgi:hypothetical protein